MSEVCTGNFEIHIGDYLSDNYLRIDYFEGQRGMILSEVQIVDYGVGNLGSVVNMVKHVGGRASICSAAGSLNHNAKIILPGVGHFGKAICRLQDEGWIVALEEARGHGAWIMGICLGMQLMTHFSEEGNCEGLGWFDLQTVRFPETTDEGKLLRVPHMGWNMARFNNRFKSQKIEESGRYYFVHSYYVDGVEDQSCWATTEYEGFSFASGIRKDRLIGVQFHPEKSHRCGVELIKYFLTVS